MRIITKLQEATLLGLLAAGGLLALIWTVGAELSETLAISYEGLLYLTTLLLVALVARVRS